MKKVIITLWFEKDEVDDADVINALQNQIDNGCLSYDEEEEKENQNEQKAAQSE